MNLITVGILGIVFVSLCSIILRVLATHGLFGPVTRVVITICVAMLSVIGMAGMLQSTPVVQPIAVQPRARNSWTLPSILVPYVTMGLMLLLIMLLCLIRRICRCLRQLKERAYSVHRSAGVGWRDVHHEQPSNPSVDRQTSQERLNR